MTEHVTSQPHPSFTAAIKQDGAWWVGWIEEIPGVNCQEGSRDELIASLKVALSETLAFNIQDARTAAGSDYSEITIAL